MKNIIAIVGPTAVGKTKLSVELAKKINAEVVNVDAMQVYSGMNIGTAKIKEEEKEGIVHHLFDIVSLTEQYSVYDYQRDCRRTIEDILSRGKRVILVGGTGLYLKAALYRYEFTPNTTTCSYEEMTNEEILEKLKEYTNSLNVHVNNRKRLVRLLNKYENGEVMSSYKDEALYDFSIIGLTTDRDKLYEMINVRTDQMFSGGLVEEVYSLKEFFSSSKALQTAIGYKEFIPYFEGRESLEEVAFNIKKNCRHYAKRQYTFFKNQFDVVWYQTNYEQFDKTIEEVYRALKKDNS